MEAEGGLVDKASRSNKQLKPNNGENFSTDSSFDNSDNNDGPLSKNGGYQMAAVLQFNPTQTDNVFMAKQVANPSSDLHMKNKDGTECVFNILGMDPLSMPIRRTTHV